MQLENLVTIGITTKDRLVDLDKTLGILLHLNLNNIPIILYDDASEKPIIALENLKKFQYLTHIRNETCQGLVYNRNRMAETARTPYLISLDDDSCFANVPPLYEAIEYLENHTSVAALEFVNIDINVDRERHFPSSPQPVKSYTGCGHMFRCSTFLELGGYREYLFYFCEELDFGQRAWQQGYEIHIFPSIVVHHRRSPIARISEKAAFYQIRNLVLYSILNTPFIIGFMRSLAVYPILLRKKSAWKNQKILWSLTLGWLRGFWLVFNHFHERKPMKLNQFIDYQKLPYARHSFK